MCFQLGIISIAEQMVQKIRKLNDDAASELLTKVITKIPNEILPSLLPEFSIGIRTKEEDAHSQNAKDWRHRLDELLLNVNALPPKRSMEWVENVGNEIENDGSAFWLNINMLKTAKNKRACSQMIKFYSQYPRLLYLLKYTFTTKKGKVLGEYIISQDKRYDIFKELPEGYLTTDEIVEHITKDE